jgi:hypothetical protein
MVMIGSLTSAGFAGQQNNASGAARSKRHGPRLTVSAGSISFGSVIVNTATTQPLTLTSSGGSAVTVSSVAISGAGFSIVAQSFPVTLDPGQSLTVMVQFDPTVTGDASGQLTINSNSGSGNAVVVTLSGTATAAVAHQVNLSWVAPADSPDPVAGYNVYRSTTSGSFSLLNPSVVTALSYVDSAVVSGSSYSYEVRSVDSSGVESTPSNQATVTVP